MMFLRSLIAAMCLLTGVAAMAEVVPAPVEAVAGGMELVMVEQPGCQYCARWDAEIAPTYPKTPEAALAPLRRIDLHAALPDDLTFARPAVFTPTFVVVRDGVEVGRIEGYPGDAFFWGLLGQILIPPATLPTN